MRVWARARADAARRRVAGASLIAALLAGAPGLAQELVDPAAPQGAEGLVIDPNAPSTLPEIAAPPQSFVSAPGGAVRVLDKLTGRIEDLALGLGAAQAVGRLALVMDDCRAPADNPAEAMAHLTIRVDDATEASFSGWMLAASPALSALDHPRYDVWVLGCDLPSA